MSVGVIAHLHNPTSAEAASLARIAEDGGADWVGLADAFWWRDVWMLLAEAARTTDRIEIGPTMTNPFLRHPFHTVAALATLQELAGPRVFVGIAAGGSELPAAAGVDRVDAPERVADLAGLVRSVATGAPLDESSGRSLEVSLAPVPVLVAGRGRRMLETAGAHADRALLWAVPDSDLDRCAGIVHAAAAGAGRRADLAWAPLVLHDAHLGDAVGHIAVYATINAPASVRHGWGVDDHAVEQIRASLVRGGTEAARDLVPAAALDDLVRRDPDPVTTAARARSIGATTIVVPSHDLASLPDRLAWARDVAARLED